MTRAAVQVDTAVAVAHEFEQVGRAPKGRGVYVAHAVLAGLIAGIAFGHSYFYTHAGSCGGGELGILLHLWIPL